MRLLTRVLASVSPRQKQNQKRTTEAQRDEAATKGINHKGHKVTQGKIDFRQRGHKDTPGTQSSRISFVLLRVLCG